MLSLMFTISFLLHQTQEQSYPPFYFVLFSFIWWEKELTSTNYYIKWHFFLFPPYSTKHGSELQHPSYQ